MDSNRLQGKNLSAQASIELLAYASFFLFVFAIAVGSFLFMQSSDTARAENAYAQEIASQFADGINVAFVAGPGFQMRVPLEQSLLGKPYTIELSARSEAAGSPTGTVYVNFEQGGDRQSASTPTITAAYGAETNGDISVEEGIIVIQSSAPFVNITNAGDKIVVSGNWVG